MNRKIIRLGAILALSAGLAGCISLLPEGDPAQLYTFKAKTTAAATPAPQSIVTVQRAPSAFTRASAGDRILVRDGAAASYIAGARWAAPASTLIDEALASAFDFSTVRLATRGEPGLTDATLRVEVRTFEAQYRDGPDSIPTAVVELRATLISMRERNVLGTRLFRAEQAAADNRTGPIVEAYDAATVKVLEEVVRWTAETVKPAPPR